ncbi:MAG: ATPase, T2SS/T4P/T4SS family [Pirellulales bacterium]|nr:ATPase, T2SS/T4P/T4SS family [Pirellulales bacterium]
MRTLPSCFIFFLAAANAFAQGADNWPSPQWIDPDTFRGPGFYFSLTKIGFCLILFFLWVRCADWVNQDTLFHRLNKNLWNSIVVGCFTFALIMMWVIPYFLPAFLLLLLAYGAPVLTYVFYYRNPQLDDHQQVLTLEHLKFVASQKLRYIGIHIDSEDPFLQQSTLGPEVELFADRDPDSTRNQNRTILARQLEGHAPTTEMIGDALDRRATQLLLNFAGQVDIRYLIDGVWHHLPPQTIEVGRQITEVLTALAIDPNDLSDSSQGKALQADFSVRFRQALDLQSESIELDITAAQRDKFHGKWEEAVGCKLTLARGNSLERWLIAFDRHSGHLHTLDDLGMRAKTAEEITASLQKTEGMVLFSTLPGDGLTSLVNVAVQSVDRYMRDFVSVEDADSPEPEIANVDPRPYNSTASERPIDILPSVSRAQPDVIICRNLVDTASAKMLCELALKDFLILSSINARDSLEALLRMLVMKVPPELVAGAVRTVVHGRLIRKLCNECKTPYRPSDELLRKLGIPPERTEHFFRAAKPQEDTVCERCDGIGYRGLIGIYEILHMHADIQKIIVSGKPQLEDLKKVAKRNGMQSEVDHGKLLVARGATSVEELQRVLKK